MREAPLVVVLVAREAYDPWLEEPEVIPAPPVTGETFVVVVIAKIYGRQPEVCGGLRATTT